MREYRLKSGIMTPFSVELLKHINETQDATSINAFFKRRGITGVDWRCHLQDRSGEIFGYNLRTELLLIGINCPNIDGEKHCAVWKNKGYYMSANSECLVMISEGIIIMDKYYVTEEQVMWEWESRVSLEYRDKVKELLLVQS